MTLNETNRNLWLFLFNNGTFLTAHDVSRRTGYPPEKVFRALHAMTKRGLLEQVPPKEGELRKRYGVTGTCWVPNRMKVGEVQA